MMRMMRGRDSRVDKVERVEGVERVEAVEEVEGVEGDNLYHSITERSKRNCMPNFTTLLATTDRGMIRRGKYTFPKIPALATNVFEVAFKHDEK
jgi:hypothetical protein